MKSNSETAIAQHARRAKEALLRGQAAGNQALEDFRDAGREISEMKKILQRGRFGREVQRQCGCSVQWARRLMKLHKQWEEYLAAVDWKNENGHAWKHRSVDGALSLVREYKRAKSGGPTPVRTQRQFTKLGKLERAVRAAEQKLAAANAMNRFLREKLAQRSPASPHTARRPLDEKTRIRIDKVAELWLRGGTDGERLGAINRLDTIAQERGWDLDQLIRECGLEGKVDFPFAA